jgi:hypothetical protein
MKQLCIVCQEDCDTVGKTYRSDRQCLGKFVGILHRPNNFFIVFVIRASCSKMPRAYMPSQQPASGFVGSSLRAQ